MSEQQQQQRRRRGRRRPRGGRGRSRRGSQNKSQQQNFTPPDEAEIEQALENAHSVEDLMDARPAELLKIAKELEVEKPEDLAPDELVRACLVAQATANGLVCCTAVDFASLRNRDRPRRNARSRSTPT